MTIKKVKADALKLVRFSIKPTKTWKPFDKLFILQRSEQAAGSIEEDIHLNTKFIEELIFISRSAIDTIAP